MDWILKNGLALYGAITGTLALAISYFGHRHNVKKDKIRLTIEYAPHPEQAENVAKLRIPKNEEKPWEGGPPNLVKYYVVTVRKLGAVPAPITDVGIKSKDGAIHQALVSVRHSSFNMLHKIPETAIRPLEPNSCESFNIYLRREDPEFKVIYAYAIDQTGKEWRSRA